MLYYVGVEIIVAIIGRLSQGREHIRLLLWEEKAKKKVKLSYCLIFSVLVLMFGLRGDFTADYSNYKYLFDYYHSTSMNQIISIQSAQEIGFIVLTKLLSNWMPYQIYLCVIGCLIVGCFMYGFVKTSNKPWIAIMLFLGFGGFFGSFNTMRQALSAAILFAGCSYLYSRNLKKYTIFVLLASSMHLTSIIMIPMFFLLDAKITRAYIIRVGIIATIAYFGFNVFMDLFRRVLPRFQAYELGRYGMTGGTVGYFVGPVVMTILIILLFFMGGGGALNRHSDMTRVQINALGYALIISILTTKVFLLQRLSGFFLPHVFVLCSNMLNAVENHTNKLFMRLIIVLLCIGYTYVSLSGTGYDPYYFFWQ